MTLTRRALLGLLPWLGAVGLVKVAPAPARPSGDVTDVVVTETLHDPASTIRYTMKGPPWPRPGEEIRLEFGGQVIDFVVEHVQGNFPRDRPGWADVAGRITGWRRG